MIKTWQERMPTMPWQANHGEVMLEQVPCMIAEIDELRAELAALKQQAPIAWLNDHRTIAFTRFDVDGFPEDIRSIYTTPLYLAPGAQPVPEGYQLVPIEPTAAMIRSYLVAQSTAAMQTDRAFGISDPMENFKAGYKAMLEAAKP